MCNRAATIPNMTTGWYMSFPMFLCVLVFQLLNDKLRNSNTETSDNKAGERIVKICQSVMETMGRTKHELHWCLGKKNKPLENLNQGQNETLDAFMRGDGIYLDDPW